MASRKAGIAIDKLIEDNETRVQKVSKQEKSILAKKNFWAKNIDEKVEYLKTEEGLAIIQSLSGQRLSQLAVADILGLSYNEFIRIRKENDDIYDAFDKGRMKDYDEVEEALFKMAKGYLVPEKRSKVVKDSKDGRHDTTIEETSERYIPADFRANSYILENKRREEWKRQQIEISEAKNRVNIQIEIIGDDELNLE